MTREELSQTITKSIEELGFARIAKPAVLQVFSSDSPSSFDIHDRIKEFAAVENLQFKESEDDQDFWVFSPSES